MKQLIAIALTLLLTLALTGCSDSDAPTGDQPSGDQPAVEQPPDDQQGPDEEPPVDEPELTQATGIFTGQIDSNFMEIEIDGVRSSYMYSRDLQWVFAELLNVGDRIVFAYSINEHGQPVVQELDTADRAGMITDVTGTYVGQIDSRSIEVKIDGEYMAFALPEQIIISNFADGDQVIIDYYEEEQTGRLVINKMRKAD